MAEQQWSYGCRRESDPVSNNTKGRSGFLLTFLQIKAIHCDSINSSIIKVCRSLTFLLVFLVAIAVVNNSPQDAEAGHSDFVIVLT